MGLPDTAIKRPVTVVMVVVLFSLLGLVSLNLTSTDLLPEITVPMIAVVTDYGGAGAREVEDLVTRPIEQALGHVSGVQGISSESSEGTSLVSAEFGWGVDLDSAMLDARDAIELIKPFLPEGVGTPRIIKADLALAPIMQIVVSGPQQPLALTRLAEDVRDEIERLEGVASVSVGGGVYEEIRVAVNPAQLLAYGLTVPQIASTLRSENLNLPGGQIDEAGRRIVVRTQGELRTVADVARVMLSTPAGALVRLDDVAEVALVETDSSQLTRINAEPAVTLSVSKQSGANTVAVARSVGRVIDELAGRLPPGHGLRIVEDQSEFINRALRQVAQNIVIGGILAVVVLYLFLCEARTVMVIGMAVPVSILATLAFVYFSGITLNIVSLGGMALGVGMLVDNAIVIIESIYRQRRAGAPPARAAAEGTRGVAAAVTASTITTVAVFLPVVFVQGLASQVFTQLAMTVSFALGSSLLVALTFVPMASALLLRLEDPDPSAPAGRLARLNAALSRASEAAQRRLGAAYATGLRWSLGHRGLTLALVAGFLLVTALGFTTMSQALMPEMDQREIEIVARLEKGSAQAWADEVLGLIDATVLARDDVDYTYGAAAGGLGLGFGAIGADTVELVAKLQPRRPGMPATPEVVAALRRDLAQVPGVDLMVSSRAGIFGEDQAFGAPLVVSVYGEDLDQLRAYGEEVAAHMRAINGVVNVRTTFQATVPELRIEVDRQRAALAGLGNAQIATLVNGAIEGQVPTTVRLAAEDVDLRVIYQAQSRDGLADVSNLLLLSPTGRLVRLNEVADVSLASGPPAIQRRDGTRLVQVEAELAGLDLGTATSLVAGRLDEVQLLPSYTMAYGGQSEEIAESFGSLGQALLMAAVLIYMVMAAQFESLRQPLIIMVTVPLALAGAVLVLALLGLPLSIASIVSVIALAGVVVNNGIVLVDYTNQLRAEGKTPVQALLAAGAVRLRPVLMTSLTTISGLLPMVVFGGEGQEIQRALAAPLLGGLAVATVLTLFVVPVLYSLLAGGPRAQRAAAETATLEVSQ